MKEREKFQNSCIFEGIVSFRAVIDSINLQNSDRKIEKVFYDAENAKRKPRELSFLKAKSYEQGYLLELTEKSVIDELTLGNSHGGLAFLCSERSYEYINENNVEKNGFYVMLDGIEDPYNFGYALRSLYTAGVTGIILSERNWLGAAGIVCRASAGASETLPIYLSKNNDYIETFKKCGYKIICSDLENSISMYDADLTLPLLLIVGGEKRGISSAILKQADTVVHIEYGTNANVALSAASASTVLAFEVYRQNKKTQ